MIYGYLRQIDWKNFMENERVNGVYASPNTVEFVLDGKTMRHMMSKW
jgi:hypothetical protein